MRANLYTIVALVLGMTGCAATMNLYPVRGPLATQSMVSPIQVTVQPLISGGVTLMLPDGVYCFGSWNLITATAPATISQPDPKSLELSLPATWDEIFGPGFYLAKVVGEKNHGRGKVSSTTHGNLYLDFLYPYTNNTIGVGVDEQGNIYKIKL